MSNRQRSGKGAAALFAPLPPVALAALAGFAVTFLLLLCFSWLFTRTQLPAWSAVPLAGAAVCAGCFACALALGRHFRRYGLFCGLCAGLFFFFVYLAAALLNGQFSFTAAGWIKLVSFVLSGCLGGLLGVIHAEKKARSRHKSKE